MLQLKVKRLQKDMDLPVKAGRLEAGIDFFCPKEIYLQSLKVTKVPLGLSLEIPEGYFLKFLDRSSMAINGLSVWGGVIDSTYRGELACVFFNSNSFQWSLGQ